MSAPNTVVPDRLKAVKIPWGPIGEPVYVRSYSQNREDGRKENWPETVVRSVRGNLELVAPEFREVGEEEALQDLLINFQSLPAGRHLNASGMKGREFLFNCHGAGWDYVEPETHFTFLFDELMQGGGVGGNYSNRYMNLMPKVGTKIDLRIICRADHPNIGEFEGRLGRKPLFKKAFRVEDSREGWVDAVGHVLKAAYTPSKNPKKARKKAVVVVLDVSDIRARGLPLKTSGGIACGPEPLVSLLLDLVEVTNRCVGGRMTSLDAMDVDHVEASCVIAGGKRRSSRMSVKSWLDHDIFEFIDCKKEDGKHWTTNISVEIDDDFIHTLQSPNDALFQHAWKVLVAVMAGAQKNGEPGFWNIDLARRGERHPERMYCPNPCGEIGLYMWENCNLGHLNLEAFVGRPRALKEAGRLMARWLVRATFGDIPNPRQRKVVDENRRIGVGFFGFHGWLALHGIKYSDSHNDPFVLKTLRELYVVIKTEATQYAAQMGIPCPVKFTTLAPTGTIAILSGATPSAQSIFARYFIRRVRYSNMDPELHKKIAQGYPHYEDPDAKNTTIVEYWCEDPLVSRVRSAGWDADAIIEDQSELSMETCLKVQTMLQETWADNAISYTINLPVDSMPSPAVMAETFRPFLGKLKGTTVFPDKTRKNSPMERLTKEAFEAYAGLKEITQVEVECVGGCPTK